MHFTNHFQDYQMNKTIKSMMRYSYTTQIYIIHIIKKFYAKRTCIMYSYGKYIGT